MKLLGNIVSAILDAASVVLGIGLWTHSNELLAYSSVVLFVGGVVRAFISYIEAE